MSSVHLSSCSTVQLGSHFDQFRHSPLLCLNLFLQMAHFCFGHLSIVVATTTFVALLSFLYDTLPIYSIPTIYMFHQGWHRYKQTKNVLAQAQT
jgi:hypothetical protein